MRKYTVRSRTVGAIAISDSNEHDPETADITLKPLSLPVVNGVPYVEVASSTPRGKCDVDEDPSSDSPSVCRDGIVTYSIGVSPESFTKDRRPLSSSWARTSAMMVQRFFIDYALEWQLTDDRQATHFANIYKDMRRLIEGKDVVCLVKPGNL
jgi:hypothetical protein